MNWFLFWLFLHVAAAIIGFGPVFVFPLIDIVAERRPGSLPFAAELAHVMGTKLILPVASTMLVSGLGLVYASSINLLKTPYLLVSLVLYLAAIGAGFMHQAPTSARILELSRQTPAPPELAVLRDRVKRVGMALASTILVIVFLMIVKPGGITTV